MWSLKEKIIYIPHNFLCDISTTKSADWLWISATNIDSPRLQIRDKSIQNCLKKEQEYISFYEPVHLLLQFKKHKYHQSYPSTKHSSTDLLSPEWQQKPIADEHSHPPERREPGADVVEVVVASGQQVPGLQLLRREALGHFIIDNALHTSPAEIEDVRHVKLRLCTASPHFLDLLFKGHWLFSNDPWGKKKSKVMMMLKIWCRWQWSF